MATQADAVKAVQMFNGYNLNDREMKVGNARAKEDSGRGGYDNKRGGGGHDGAGRPGGPHKARGGARRY